MYELREKLCEELERYSRKENLSAGDLDVLHKLASTIKNLDKIMMREGRSENGYSREGYSRDGEWQADIRQARAAAVAWHKNPNALAEFLCRMKNLDEITEERVDFMRIPP